MVFPFHHESKRKAMDIPFEQRRQLSDAEREEMRNYYKKVQASSIDTEQLPESEPPRVTITVRL